MVRLCVRREVPFPKHKVIVRRVSVTGKRDTHP